MNRKITFTNNSFLTGKATLYIHPDEIDRVRDELGVVVETPPTEPVAGPDPKRINASGFSV